MNHRFPLARIGLLAACLSLLAAPSPAMAAPPATTPAPCDDERLERLARQIEELEHALAAERARRETLEARARALFEDLRRLHERIATAEE